MMIRTFAASAAVLMLATGGALAQAAPAAGDQTCASLNAMAEADRPTFAKDYIEARKAGNDGAAALRNTEPNVGAAANQAGEPGKASGGPGDQAAADPMKAPAPGGMAAAPDNGQPSAPGAMDNRNEELNQAAQSTETKKPGEGMAASPPQTPMAAGAADNRNEELDQAANGKPAGGEPTTPAAPAPNAGMAANDAAGKVTADDAVKSFDGIDAAGLVAACAAAPDKTFVEVFPMPPAPAQ